MSLTVYDIIFYTILTDFLRHQKYQMITLLYICQIKVVLDSTAHLAIADVF